MILGASLLTINLNELPVVMDGQLCHPQRLMVRSVPNVSDTVKLLGGKIIAKFPQIGWSVAQFEADKLQIAKKNLDHKLGSNNVQYDRASQLAYTPNDSYWANQWHMRQIKADLAWDTSFGNADSIVAVIDTGVLVTHSDLAGNVWVNSGEIASNGIDDDNNGYVDDVNGFDFAYNDGNPEDTLGHGTACAGLVGAVQDNNLGVTGVCPRVRLMALKACNDSGYLYDSYLVPAYIYGADRGARVFSMSYFSDRVSQPEKDAMDYAVSKNVLPVAAAGNASSVIPFYPGAYENVLSVAATDGNNSRSWFSNYGSWVDVAAPGQDLITTANNGDYTGFAGTSGACPHVAGAAALLVGAKPTATAQQVREALEDSAILLNQPPFGEFSNYGLINVQAALQALLTVPAPPKAPVVRYVTVLGQSVASNAIDPSRSVTSRIYGRGFQGIQNLAVKRNGVPANILSITRDYIDYQHVYRTAGDVTIWNGNSLIATVPNPIVKRTVHPLCEASNPSAWVDGGFSEALTDDNVNLVSHRDGDGNIILQGTFRKVNNNNITQLRIKRSYQVGGATEYIQVYDWASASYPYANWITIGQQTAVASPTVTTIDIPNLAPYIDVEHTSYVRIYLAGADPNELMKIDSLRLQDSR